MKQGRARTRCGTRWLWLALATWLLATAAQAGQVTVRAFLDRNQVQLGDTVTLNVKVDGPTRVPAPDVSALHADFDILGTSQNFSASLVNGKVNVKTLWAIGLRPLHTGTITIPPLTVDGHTTAPLTLTVSAASATAHGGPGDPVFIRVQPSTLTPYVGQQVDLAVKLFYAPNVASGSLNLPQAKRLSVRKMGKGTRYESQRGGRIYQVLEKHYAITAHQAGTLKLAPVTFTGKMVSGDRFAMFFGRGKTVTARSTPLQLDVRARPAAAGKGAWLPARKVTLQLDGLPADGHVTAGQPLTLTLTETAVGLPFESLPEPRLPTLAGVDVYPGRSQDHTGNQGHWLEGTRTRKFALIPQHDGTLTIPAITLAWWNVKTNHSEVARIPAHTLQAVGGAGAGSQQQTAPPAPVASTAVPTPAPAAAPPVKSPPAPATTTRAPSGHRLAWIALGLWLATMLAALLVWWWRRRQRTAAARPTADSTRVGRHRLRDDFLRAARGGDVVAQCESLLAWARQARPQLHSLGELAAALDAPPQREAIAALQRARYAGADAGPAAEVLLAAFRGGLTWRDSAPAHAPDAVLPPLYP